MTEGPTVLDASAVLAVFRDEVGAAGVELEGALVSAVNWAEVVQRLARERVDVPVLRARAVASGLVIVDFDVALAEATGALWEATRAAGLSLGDRACLALARATGATAVTADRAWVALDVGIEIRLVR